MNTKQVKRMRKQLKYNSNNKTKSEEQQKLKKQYKELKKNYKTAPQLKQESLNAQHVQRYEQALQNEMELNKELLIIRQTRQKEKKAKRLTQQPNELMVAGTIRRQKHIETQNILEKEEKRIRKEIEQKNEEKQLEWAKEETEKKIARRKNREEMKKNKSSNASPTEQTPA